MSDDPIYLSDFQNTPPRFSASQERTLAFLADVHAHAAGPEHAGTRRLLERYAVKGDKISARSFECPDLYADPGESKICHSDIKTRTDFYAGRSLEVLESLYAQRAAPDHLIHVTCTGYASPSPAQKLIATRGWRTDVTHAYHMGCYASLPALRLAWGQSLRGQAVDVVHNEMCSLHLHPEEHTAEQIVVQTLFADGHIRYRVGREAGALKVLRIEEQIIPNSADDMTWAPGPNGMMMTLSREVPAKIQACLREFTLKLIEGAGLPTSTVLRDGVFAVHPGGPKIIETVGQVLELRDEQIDDSRRVLFERGNMSSATLPHIWQRIVARRHPAGTAIVSLAFGPGLTVFGAVFEVV